MLGASLHVIPHDSQPSKTAKVECNIMMSAQHREGKALLVSTTSGEHRPIRRTVPELAAASAFARQPPPSSQACAHVFRRLLAGNALSLSLSREAGQPRHRRIQLYQNVRLR